VSWSSKLFTIRGIPVRVHVSFLLIVGWAAYIGLSAGEGGWRLSLGGAAFMVTFVLLLFACVVLHELGHSLVAQLFGIRVQDITLWPIGGVARMAKMPEKPYQEFLITAAGPATNILLTIGLGALALVWIGPDQLLRLVTSSWLLSRFLSEMNGQALLLLLTANNAILALFNLIPAFPMDGGRLLRSLLAVFLPYPTATRAASVVGQVLATFIGTAALLAGNIMLALVGLFVFMAAWQERQQAITQGALAGLRVRQAMQPVGPRLHPLQTLSEAAAQAATSPQPAYLVVDGGRLVGLLTRGELINAMRRAGPRAAAGAGPAARVGSHLHRDVLQLRADDLLLAARKQLQERSAVMGIVVENGQVIGTLSQLDLARLVDMLRAHPQALPRG